MLLENIYMHIACVLKQRIDTVDLGMVYTETFDMQIKKKNFFQIY